MHRVLSTLSLLVATTALAQPKSPPGPPPELAFEKSLVGTWLCEGKQEPTPELPDGKRHLRQECKLGKAGFWLECEVFATTGPMKDQSVISSFIGWDPVQKKHIRSSFNMSGASTLSSTPGWEGDKITFTGELTRAGKKLPFKMTELKKSDTETTGTLEIDGKPIGDDTCKKIK